MTISPSDRNELTARLGSARQMLNQLRSELKTGKVKPDYWAARLNELADLLEDLNEERAARSEHERLAALYEVSKVLGSSLDVQHVLEQVMDAIIQLTGAERGFLMLFDERGDLEVRAARNFERETLGEDEFSFSRSVIRTVAETGEQVVTINATEDPRFAKQSSVIAHNLRSIQCVPLRARGQIIGVIYVDNRIRTSAFDKDDLAMLSAFAAQASVAIENARLFTRTDEALAARVEELSMMQEIDRQLNETLNFGETMKLTLEWAMKVTRADNGAIGLIDLEEGTARVIAQLGDAPSNVVAVLADQPSDTADAASLMVPIQREGHVIGVIALDRQDGSPFDQEAHAFMLRLAEHAAISIENARLYEAVKRANDAKSEFVSVIAHELRLPMTSIRGYADMLGMVGTLTEQQAGFLRIIRSNVERMGVLISDLSDIARIEAGRLNLELADDVIFKAVLDDVALSLQAEQESRGHRLVMDIPSDLPRVRADPKRLAQVLTNLLSNAYKYTPPGGQITVLARQEGQFLRCGVKDTGVGMTAEELAKLYTKFWRADDPYVREQHGTGLGLTIARRLVEMQGGEMSVESEKGVGTTFWFTLPIGE
ncbi:MAG: hypothetical protein Kow00124_32000 [Anaerolineae bacterium]